MLDRKDLGQRTHDVMVSNWIMPLWVNKGVTQCVVLLVPLLCECVVLPQQSDALCVGLGDLA